MMDSAAYPEDNNSSSSTPSNTTSPLAESIAPEAEGIASSGTHPLFLGFNQDFSCFACGLENGFQVWNASPLKQRYQRELDGGIAFTELLFRTNIVALVGGGRRPYAAPTKVLIWDDYQGRPIAELAFRREVKSVRLRRDRVAVALENKVYFYNFADFTLIASYDTAPNPRGLLAVAADESAEVAVFPGNKPAHVRVVRGRSNHVIEAHNSAVGVMALNSDGSKLATASENGTVIRVWDTVTGSMLNETRRGTARKTVHCLAFSRDSKWLCASSEGGTIHVMDVQGAKTQKSMLSSIGGFVPSSLTSLSSYSTSNFSFARIHLNLSRAICGFDDDNNIIAVGDDGSYHAYEFDQAQGGEGRKIDSQIFFKPEQGH